ncbi:MAG: UDP-N-acetylmuramoyl-L-alanyl-D-glutamate--2,6-diaminopimelate ligase, partial [Deltaproteobacteria bacterium]|nr:UDP-N-acetylmuramoyl-L-alanyl-D-glutamate--2,6-diaminopimelate ligase [Deltaproteobacteria bacterium]
MSGGAARTATLAELLAGLELLAVRGELTTAVRGVSYDSRTVAPGHLFVALPGARHDGHAFLEQACRQGAAALLVEAPPSRAPAGVVVAQVGSTRAALAQVARSFFGDPSTRLRVSGVTGTNGKTTFTYLLEEMLVAAGRRAGLIGTLGMRYGEVLRSTRNTTPESLDLQEMLRQ